MSSPPESSSTASAAPSRIVVAGSTGYLGKFVAKELKRRGHWVRVLSRSLEALEKPGPFTAPAIGRDEVDDVFIGEVTRPETLAGLYDGIDRVFSSVGISRQRDGLSFEQVDYQGNRNLIDLCAESSVRKFVYVSMLGADQIAQLAITKAHEKVVSDLEESELEYTIVRPSGYFSDMGVVLDMARRGRVWLVGDGSNRFNPIHGSDLASACADSLEGNAREVEAGGPDVLTQRQVAELAFEVLGNSQGKISQVPDWLVRGGVRLVGLLNTQFGDLAEFIATAGDVDAVAPAVGKISLRSYFEELKAAAEA